MGEWVDGGSQVFQLDWKVIDKQAKEATSMRYGLESAYQFI